MNSAVRERLSTKTLSSLFDQMANARLIDGEAVLRLDSYAKRVGDGQEHAIAPASDNQDRRFGRSRFCRGQWTVCKQYAPTKFGHAAFHH
jgi:hypothetical protein